MLLSLPMKFLFALLMGAIIGLERKSSHQSFSENHEESSAGGIRTYALVSLLGAFAGFLYLSDFSLIGVMITAFVGLIVLIYYAIGSYFTRRVGMTNEISIFVTFVLGFLSMTEIVPIQVIVILLVVTLLVLSIKSETDHFMKGISDHEVQSFISYALIALVVLPLLPNTAITIGQVPFLQTLLNGYGVDLGSFASVEIFNPRKLWFIVALVTGIDVFGHALGRLVGKKKSFTLTSFVAGFVSSTSATQSLAQKSKRTGMIFPLLGAALLANMASFFQVFLLVGPLNSAWLVFLTPTLLAIILLSGFLAIYFLKKKEDHHEEGKKEKKDQPVEEKKIFSLIPALKFAGLLIGVKFFTKISLILFGNSGFVISSVIASLAGIDAIVITLAELAGKEITFATALFTFILVNATNLISKSVYVYLQANRTFALKFLASVIGIILISFIGFIF